MSAQPRHQPLPGGLTEHDHALLRAFARLLVDDYLAELEAGRAEKTGVQPEALARDRQSPE